MKAVGMFVPFLHVKKTDIALRQTNGFDTILAPEFVRPRSSIDSRKRKPWTPSINFNKHLPDDEISIDVEGSRKQALIRVVDPFREQLTVECESVPLTVAFRDVLPPPVFTPVVNHTIRIIIPSEPAPTAPQAPTPVSSTAPQFMAIREFKIRRLQTTKYKLRLDERCPLFVALG